MINDGPKLTPAPVMRRISAAMVDGLFFLSFAVVAAFLVYYVIDEFFVDIQALSDSITSVGVQMGIYSTSIDSLGNSIVTVIMPPSSDSAAFAIYSSNMAAFNLAVQDEFALFNTLLIIIFSASTFLSGVIVYVLIPFMYGNGQTVGKKFLRMQVLTNRGERLTKMQVFMRFALGIWFAEMFFSFILYTATAPLPLFIVISLIMLIFSSNHRSLHDLIASTMVVNADEILTPRKTDAQEVEELRKKDLLEMENLQKKLRD